VGKGLHLPLAPLETHVQRLRIRLGRRSEKSLKTRSTCCESLSHTGLRHLDLDTGEGIRAGDLHPRQRASLDLPWCSDGRQEHLLHPTNMKSDAITSRVWCDL